MTSRVAIQVAIRAENSEDELVRDLASVTLVEQAVLDIIDEHKFSNVSSVSAKTGEPVHQHRLKAGQSVETPGIDSILVVSRHGFRQMLQVHLEAQEELLGKVTYIDDGEQEEEDES